MIALSYRSILNFAYWNGKLSMESVKNNKRKAERVLKINLHWTCSLLFRFFWLKSDNITVSWRFVDYFKVISGCVFFKSSNYTRKFSNIIMLKTIQWCNLNIMLKFCAEQHYCDVTTFLQSYFVVTLNDFYINRGYWPNCWKV